MTKSEFEKALIREGFVLEAGAQYPSVVCEKRDLKRFSRRVRQLGKELSYGQSFAVRSFREGMGLVSSKGEGSSLSGLLSGDVSEGFACDEVSLGKAVSAALDVSADVKLKVSDALGDAPAAHEEISEKPQPSSPINPMRAMFPVFVNRS